MIRSQFHTCQVKTKWKHVHVCVGEKEKGRGVLEGLFPDVCDRGRPPWTSLDPGRFEGITGTLLWLSDNYRFRATSEGPNHFCMEKKKKKKKTKRECGKSRKWCLTQTHLSMASHKAKRLILLCGCFGGTDIQRNIKHGNIKQHKAAGNE